MSWGFVSGQLAVLTAILVGFKTHFYLRTGRFTVVRSTQGRLLGANLRVIQRVLGEDGQNAAAERRKKKKKKKKKKEEDVGSGLVYVIVLDCPWIVDFAIQAGWNLRTASYGVLS
jgi:hypothetical protein